MSESKIGNIGTNEFSENNIQLIDEKNKRVVASFLIEKIKTNKQAIKVIKEIEKLVRRSSAYKNYIGLLKNEVGLDNDSFFGKINDDSVSIEMHHYPLTLFEIVEVVIIDNLIKKKPFTTFSISKEVLKLHEKNLVGLVPLMETNHQLAHSGKLKISLTQVFGKIDEFIEKYTDSIKPSIVKKLKKIFDESKAYELAPDVGILAVNKVTRR